MESINIQKIDKKWQDFWSKKNRTSKKKKKEKKFYCLKCFHILLVKFTWDMLEIIQLEM